MFANKIAAIEDPDEREAFVAEQRPIYEEDVDLLRLASELVVDAVVDFGDLRDEIVRRLERARGKDRHFSDRRHGVPPSERVRRRGGSCRAPLPHVGRAAPLRLRSVPAWRGRRR